MAEPTDTEMLDWLDRQTGSYSTHVVWRWSSRGRGWRLHEVRPTDYEDAALTVRKAITQAMQREATNATPAT